ncbi:MAG: triose-phosphate isomerase [Verrucomicrobia bacterium]|nr:MAG: triose-phosphate isomerase [Verrucomicrobiota bacterium]
MRKPIVAGNWKMNKTRAEAAALVAGIKAEVGSINAVETVVCVPFTDLDLVAQAVKGSILGLGAQNVHWAEKGAFTGEISAAMLKELGVTYVIIGHSERRQYFGETDATVNQRAKAALVAGLKPIVCVGETLMEREAGQTTQVVERQARVGLAGLQGADWDKLVIAYEPVWAIGTGKTATTAQAQEVHAFIRKLLGELAGTETAAKIRIQYGGSMKPENAKELMSQPDIDGGLIGGASLEAGSFAAIVRGAVR